MPCTGSIEPHDVTGQDCFGYHLHWDVNIGAVQWGTSACIKALEAACENVSQGPIFAKMNCGVEGAVDARLIECQESAERNSGNSVASDKYRSCQG